MSVTDEPLTYEFEMRGYEAGRDGIVPPSGMSRYLEMMRWRIAVGPWANGGLERGVVRAQTHAYLAPVRFPAPLRGTTQVCRVGGSSFDFAHTMHAGDTLVLRARTTIVCLDAEGHPADAGDALRAVAREVPDCPAHTRVSAGEPAHEWRVAVRPSDEDMFRHVNQARYLDFLDDARRGAGLPRMTGLTVSYEREVHHGQSLVVCIDGGTNTPDGRLHGYGIFREDPASGERTLVNRGGFKA